MSISVTSYQSYMGKINTSSKRYQAAKKMYDEGHSTGNIKSVQEGKNDMKLSELKMLKKMLGVDTDDIPMTFKSIFEADEETFIRNYMSLFDENGDLINSYGVSGMDITGKDPSEWHKIVDISENARQDMFEETKRHFIQENGVANGDTTMRSEVFARYQKSAAKADRLSGTWTLEQYEKAYRSAFYEAVKEADPKWRLGQNFDKNIIRSISREDVEKRIIQTGSDTLSLRSNNSLNMKV